MMLLKRNKGHKHINAFIRKALNYNRSSDGTDSHLITCFSMAISIKAERILELGVRGGNATLAFLTAARQTGGFVESVDLSPTDFKCPEEFKPSWKFYQSDSIEFLGNIPEGLVYDLVFVDDWHSYEHVASELELLTPHVNKSSIVLLHDLMHTHSQPNYMDYDDSNYLQVWEKEPYVSHRKEFANGGPYRAVKELDSAVWEFATIPVGHGLTILRKKD
jgi:predicted O-methyltransferase YrrM